jgi:hypothetical protein
MVMQTNRFKIENSVKIMCEAQEATKREPSACGYNRATLFQGDINTGAWPSRLVESQI